MCRNPLQSHVEHRLEDKDEILGFAFGTQYSFMHMHEMNIEACRRLTVADR